MLKKTIAILLSMFVILSLAACGNSANRTGQSAVEGDFAEISTNDDMSEKDSNADDMENAEISETQQGEGESSKGQETKVLVAYFSATNTTKGVAEHIADGLHADLYEIVPEEPYTDADLNYNDNNSRTTIEMNDPDVRPAISGSVENMEEYDVVFIGYPNWWASIPMPVASFLEEYDFSGKTIIPFCSHGGGRFGQSLTAIAKLAPDAAMGEALSVHYSGGNSLSDDVTGWLRENGIIE